MTSKPLKFPLAITLLSLGLGQAAQSEDLIITGVTVYPAPDAPALKGATVEILSGQITKVGRSASTIKGVETLACPGCVVLAGFWNSHVHFMEPKWNDAAHQPADKLTSALGEMVTRSGFTTVVDTGSDGANTIALRRRVESREVLGPRILTAGLPIFPARALPYYLADLPPDFKAKMAQPATAEEAVGIVDANHSAGTDIVKLFTGSIVAPDRITPMNVEIARAAVNEAHRFGQLVFSHPSNLEGTQVAVAAGVDVLAHTPEVTEGIDEAMLKRMVAQHMAIIPTLKLFSKDEDIAKIRALDFQFHQLGGALLYGTDTGFLTDYDQGEELKQLRLAGFGFRDILGMLTTAPAKLFHLSDSEGKVMKGMRGDLTVLAHDPSTGNIDAFSDVIYVIRGGRVIWRRPASR